MAVYANHGHRAGWVRFRCQYSVRVSSLPEVLSSPSIQDKEGAQHRCFS